MKKITTLGLCHQRANFFKYHPGHFGRHGMNRYRVHYNRTWSKTINLDKLWTLLSENARKQFTGEGKSAPVIDVTKNGFDKVIGRGRLPKIPVIVKARRFSKHAQDAIQSVGGACVLVA